MTSHREPASGNAASGASKGRLSTPRAAEEAARVLRETILERLEVGSGSDGATQIFLGPEDQLAIEVGVSKPTLRQALRLLEHEHLVEVRRGAGVFGRMPTADALTQAASPFLRLQNTTYGDLVCAARALSSQAAALAAERPEDEVRRKVADYYDLALQHKDRDSLSNRDLAALTVGFHRALAEACGNAPLNLFVIVTQHLALPISEAIITHERAAVAEHAYREAGLAVWAQDSTRATTIVYDHLSVAIEWDSASQRLSEYRRAERHSL